MLQMTQRPSLYITTFPYDYNILHFHWFYISDRLTLVYFKNQS